MVIRLHVILIKVGSQYFYFETTLDSIYNIHSRKFIILHWDCNMHHARIICKGQDHFYKNFTFLRKKDLQNINHSSLSVHALYTVLTTFLNVGRAGKLFPWEQQKNPGKKEPDAQNLLHFLLFLPTSQCSWYIYS